tara:strand:- start:822 stop:1238 length:417 start_codon:yes stop_codon:yes gene_type:complete
MGADFLCASIPAAHIDDEREAGLKKIVAAATEEDFLELTESGVCPDEASDELRQGVFEALKEYLLADASRETDRRSEAGMDYEVFVTGGMSWGDSPTEIFDAFCVLGSFSPVYNKLEEWAKADFKNKCPMEPPHANGS